MHILVIMTKYFITINGSLSCNSKDNGWNESDTCLCLTNIELNMRVGKVFRFTSEINVLVLLPMHLKFNTACWRSFWHLCHSYPTWQVKFNDDSCLTWVSHKRQEVWGSFYAIPALPMHLYSVMWNSDLKGVEGQNKIVYKPKVKIASMTCRKVTNEELWWVLESIAIWRNIMSSWKCKSEEIWWAL